MSTPSTDFSATGTSSSRRPSGQPKSSRKQYTACGACRLRRVKCDLRDLQQTATGGKPLICTNCAQRNINCVDEYVDFKAARQQMHQTLQAGDSEGTANTEERTLSSSPTPPPIVSLPHPEFFRSTFFRQFCLKNPIFDPTDFQFIDPGQGQLNENIPIERRILAMVLLAWATSLDLDERGNPRNHISLQAADEEDSRYRQPGADANGATLLLTNALVNDILNLIDAHGLMRNPTWDGVRLLLLIWPLTRGTQRQLERITMFESILSQIHALSRFGNTTLRAGEDPYREALSRARVFWYAYTCEGITNALKGGRLMMNPDDLDEFYQTLPPQSFPMGQSSVSSLTSIINATSPYSDVIQAMADTRYRSQSTTFLLYQLTTRLFDLTLQVAATCRKIHAILTGPKARQLSLEHNGYLAIGEMTSIWDGLDRSWVGLEGTRESGLWNGGVDQMCPMEDVDSFASGWQILIFECHNIIREALQQRILYQPQASSSISSTPPPITQNLLDLHTHATKKCQNILPNVLIILKRHIRMPMSGLFRSNTDSVCNGCVFAGFMLAQGDFDGDANGQSLQSVMGLEEGMDVCLSALDQMHWAFADNANAKETLMAAWDARQTRDRQHHGNSMSAADEHYGGQLGLSQQWSPLPESGSSHTFNSSSSFYDSAYAYGQEDEASRTQWTGSELEHLGTTMQLMQGTDSARPNYTFAPEEWFSYESSR